MDSGSDIFIAGKVLTIITFGPIFDPDSYLTSLSNKNKAGKALKLCDLVLSKAVHSSWIWIKSKLDIDADLVKDFFDFSSVVGESIGDGVPSEEQGAPLAANLLGPLRLLGLMAIRWRAAA